MAADQSILAAVAFSSGAIAAYGMAKLRENAIGAVNEARLRSEVELARREATLEAAELQATAENAFREAARLKATAEVEAQAAAELRTENERRRDFLARELQKIAGLDAEAARRRAERWQPWSARVCAPMRS